LKELVTLAKYYIFEAFTKLALDNGKVIEENGKRYYQKFREKPPTFAQMTEKFKNESDAIQKTEETKIKVKIPEMEEKKNNKALLQVHLK